MNPMNPRDSAKSGKEAIRSFTSLSNVVFLVVLAGVVMVAAMCAAGPEKGEPEPSTVTTTL